MYIKWIIIYIRIYPLIVNLFDLTEIRYYGFHLNVTHKNRIQTYLNHLSTKNIKYTFVNTPDTSDSNHEVTDKAKPCYLRIYKKLVEM